MKIAFFETEPWEKEYISLKLAEQEVSFFSEPLTVENAKLAEGCDVVSIFIYSKIDKEVLSKLPDLKMIQTTIERSLVSVLWSEGFIQN